MIRTVMISLASLFFGVAACAEPAAMTVAADSMDYDTNTGHALLKGNVEVRRDALTLKAAQGEGWSTTGKVELEGDVVLSGVYEGAPLHVTSEKASGLLAGDPDFVFEGAVSARHGSRFLDCQKLTYGRGRFEGVKVTRCDDGAAGLSLVGGLVKGSYGDEGLRSLHAQEAVKVVHKTDDGPVKVWANQVDYNASSNVMTARGAARAEQGSRKLSAAELIYNLKTGQIKAKGRAKVLFPGERS